MPPHTQIDGDRSRKSREELWKSLPPVYRQGAVCYTDFWQAYNAVFPEKGINPRAKVAAKLGILNGLIIS